MRTYIYTCTFVIFIHVYIYTCIVYIHVLYVHVYVHTVKPIIIKLPSEDTSLVLITHLQDIPYYPLKRGHLSSMDIHLHVHVHVFLGPRWLIACVYMYVHVHVCQGFIQEPAWVSPLWILDFKHNNSIASAFPYMYIHVHWGCCMIFNFLSHWGC